MSKISQGLAELAELVMVSSMAVANLGWIERGGGVDASIPVSRFYCYSILVITIRCYQNTIIGCMPLQREVLSGLRFFGSKTPASLYSKIKARIGRGRALPGPPARNRARVIPNQPVYLFGHARARFPL